jgi:hypothetical protein
MNDEFKLELKQNRQIIYANKGTKIKSLCIAFLLFIKKKYTGENL